MEVPVSPLLHGTTNGNANLFFVLVLHTLQYSLTVLRHRRSNFSLVCFPQGLLTPMLMGSALSLDSDPVPVSSSIHQKRQPIADKTR